MTPVDDPWSPNSPHLSANPQRSRAHMQRCKRASTHASTHCRWMPARMQTRTADGCTHARKQPRQVEASMRARTQNRWRCSCMEARTTVRGARRSQTGAHIHVSMCASRMHASAHNNRRRTRAWHRLADTYMCALMHSCMQARTTVGGARMNRLAHKQKRVRTL